VPSIRLKILGAKSSRRETRISGSLKETMEWIIYTENLPFAYLKEKS